MDYKQRNQRVSADDGILAWEVLSLIDNFINWHNIDSLEALCSLLSHTTAGHYLVKDLVELAGYAPLAKKDEKED